MQPGDGAFKHQRRDRNLRPLAASERLMTSSVAVLGLAARRGVCRRYGRDGRTHGAARGSGRQFRREPAARLRDPDCRQCAPRHGRDSREVSGQDLAAPLNLLGRIIAARSTTAMQDYFTGFVACELRHCRMMSSTASLGGITLFSRLRMSPRRMNRPAALCVNSVSTAASILMRLS